MKRARYFLRDSLLIGIGWLACASGCGGAGSGGDQLPAPALSGSPAAQAELRAILQRFAAGSRDERIALREPLIAFRRRHLGDALVRVADVHLAWIALERGSLSHAESLATLLAQQRPGTARDLAEVVRGAALRRRGLPREAYAVLRPLVGKLIDAYARAMLNQEVVTAATEARLWDEAVELSSVWLREAADDERAAARVRIQELLPKIPPEDLARLLRKRQLAQPGDIPEPELALRTLLAERLATVAQERRDVRLAQELLARSGPLLGGRGDAIAQLAAGATTARVGAPTVGLLLSVRTAVGRRRGVDVAAGVAFGLGLLRQGEDSAGAVRLVSRDDGTESEDRTAEGLSGLVAEGAAVLIAGVDRGQATAVAAFARTQEIPVLLLHPPDPRAAEGPFVFVVGEDPARVGQALVSALVERSAKPVALVAGAESIASTSSSAAEVTLSCDGPLEGRTLRLAGVRGLALNGDAFCAERALAAADGLKLRVAFGLEAAAEPEEADALIATAGPFPFVGTPTNSVLGSWMQARATPPGWWAAVARDAAVLAQAGVRELPARGTEDPAQVKARRRAVAEAVAKVEAALWTTEAPGFSGARRLPREIGVRDLARRGR